MPFIIGLRYSRKDVYQILSVPTERQGGNWDTGYNRYEKDWFIFVNVNTKGRTGHDYANRFIGTDLLWFGKNKSKLSHPQSKKIIDPATNTYFFVREDSNDSYFFYLGNGRAKEIHDTIPINILWTFNVTSEINPEFEVTSSQEALIEGAKKKITINTYERNPKARQLCLDHFGYSCSICSFNFYNVYGDIGKNFTHVHHLKLLREIGVEYEINPIEDLRPVCPNCHAMLHKRDPVYSIEELKQIILYTI